MSFPSVTESSAHQKIQQGRFPETTATTEAGTRHEKRLTCESV